MGLNRLAAILSAGLALQSVGQAPPPTAMPAQAAATPAASEAAVRLEIRLAADPAAERQWLARIAIAFSHEPSPQLAAMQAEVATVFRLRSERISRRDPSWPDAQADAILMLIMIDARRFATDPDFRANVVPVMRDALTSEVPVGARKRMLARLNNLEFGAAERIEVAWGLARRSSRSREVVFGTWPTRLGSAHPIRSSVYALPSAFFEYPESADFLRAVHALAPERDIIVLSNAPLVDELRPLADEMPLHLIDTLGRHYTPWPRDPFALVSQPNGPVVVVTRPNVQARREFDLYMGRELIQGLPDRLDVAWGGVEWMVAPIPFHGGHTLATPGTTWASVHTLLPRIVEILGHTPTPGELTQPSNLSAFLDATRLAQEEFESVFGQPVRFVHALPNRASSPELEELETMLIGGGTSDLDSLVTILPGVREDRVALVADFTIGRALLEEVDGDELDRFRVDFHLTATGEELRRQLREQPLTEVNRRIDAFLDHTSRYLREQGMEVQRLPLLHVPEHLVEERLRLVRDGFLITWTNVVHEQVDGELRAEGFASGLSTIDKRATETFRVAGVTLRLVPGLARSVMRDGGYRCASNHVRQG
jgi:hypothetical protein